MKKQGFMRSRFVCCLLLILTAAKPATRPAPTVTLADWVGRNAWHPGQKKLSLPVPVVTVTLATEEERHDGRDFAPVLNVASLLAEGEVQYLTITNRGAQSGNGKCKDLAALQQSLTRLPAGVTTLPPPDRRVLIEFGDKAYVYDRGNLPPEVRDCVKLIPSAIPAWTPGFEPQLILPVGGRSNRGVLALSSDGKQLMTVEARRMQTLIDLETRNVLSQAKWNYPGAESSAVSPDRKWLAMDAAGEILVMDSERWQVQHKLSAAREIKALRRPAFTADGQWILAGFPNRAPLRTFDLKTGQVAATPAYIPRDASTWIESPSGKRAIAALRDDVIVLWDIAAGRRIVNLVEGLQIDHAVFSPDESKVAVATRTTDGRDDGGLAIYQTTDGKKLHDLLVVDTAMYSVVETLAWSPDGRYVLAGTSQDPAFSSRIIAVWSATTGRHRGTLLDGTLLRLTGMVLTPDGRQLIVASEDGNVHFWDLAAVLNGIRAFEASLGEKAD